MKNQNISRFVALAAITTLALFAGCKKQADPSEHDGHDHGKAETAPTGTAAAAVQPPGSGDQCAKHTAPKELCFICDASLRDKARLWCNEHDRYEDRCWICHPEAQDKKRLWCKEHSLYEDECFLCHPEVKKKGV